MSALSMIGRLRAALAQADPTIAAAELLHQLVDQELDRLPRPGSGSTLHRWQALAEVAGHDLSLAKLYEGHTDALEILSELGDPTIGEISAARAVLGVWAAEAPGSRVLIEAATDGRLALHGRKAWCSGAGHLSHGLLTAWHSDGRGPQLVRVAMQQNSITVDDRCWQAVGMAGSASVDVQFDGALAAAVGSPGDYLTRPGFWQGGAGIAACWYGGARSLGFAVRDALMPVPPGQRSLLRQIALGRIDLALAATAALLRQGAAWIDANPCADCRPVALRLRLAAEDCARSVLDEAGRALGAAAFCRDARFARMAADLPVFIRQSHAERDFAVLAESLPLSDDTLWHL